jgi:hypothetical protein
MEGGRLVEHVSLKAHRKDLVRSMKTPFGDRNSHMVGTTSILRLAFGRLPGDDRPGEFLRLKNEPNLQHIFECFALVNKRLCSAVVKAALDGRKNRAANVLTMDRACLPHLEATIRILEPNIIVLQSVQLRKLIGPRLENVRYIKRHLDALEYAEFSGVETLVASFSHPAAYGPLNWGNSSEDRYLLHKVVPVIVAARNFWLGE